MDSGIILSQDALDKYATLQKKKNIAGYITFMIDGASKEIVAEGVEEGFTGDKGTEEDWKNDYTTFLNSLKEGECRWYTYDFQFLVEGGGRRRKIVFISWCPDAVPLKPKMLFASTQGTLRGQLKGVAGDIHATEKSDITYEAVVDRVKRN